MISANPDRTLTRYARLAGAMYLAIIATSLLSLIFIDSRLILTGDAAVTAAAVVASQTLFRIELACDLTMFAGVVALSFALYVILRRVDKNLALLGLLWRMTEAILGAATVLFGFVVVILVNDQDYRASFGPGVVDTLIDLLVTAREVGYDAVLFFLALGTIVNCLLLYRSRYVPRILAGFGVASFVLMLMGILASMIVPGARDVALATWTPGIVFEVAIGGLLLVKGVTVPLSESSGNVVVAPA